MKIDTAKMNCVTCSIASVTPMIPTASTSRGSVPIQNLDQSSARIGNGLDLSSHSVRPSTLTAGKMNRAATEASTKPASPRFRNGIVFTRKVVIPAPLSGRNFTLNTYTSTSTASRISCDHCVVSRKKTRSSFITSSRRRMPNGLRMKWPACRAMRPRTHRCVLSCAFVNPDVYSD